MPSYPNVPTDMLVARRVHRPLLPDRVIFLPSFFTPAAFRDSQVTTASATAVWK